MLSTTDIMASQRNLAPILEELILKTEAAVQQAVGLLADWGNSGAMGTQERSTQKPEVENVTQSLRYK